MTLKDGYAPFCKHIFVNNFTDTVSAFIKITPDNEKYLKSGYQARNEKELPVLGRWFDHSQMPEGTVGKAQFLDIILYSKEQVQKENASMGNEDPNKDIDY